MMSTELATSRTFQVATTAACFASDARDNGSMRQGWRTKVIANQTRPCPPQGPLLDGLGLAEPYG